MAHASMGTSRVAFGPLAQPRVSVVEHRDADHPLLCRCGTHIPTGGAYLAVAAPAPVLEGVFLGVGFCSLGCVRAHMLETLATLEAIDTPGAGAIVADLREMYVEAGALFSRVLREPR